MYMKVEIMEDKIIVIAIIIDLFILACKTIHLGKNPNRGGIPLIDKIEINKISFCFVFIVLIWFKYIILFFFMVIIIIVIKIVYVEKKYINWNFDNFVAVIIHGLLEIDEYAIIFFVDDCFNPTIVLINKFRIIIGFNMFMLINCLVKIVGAIFCQVDNNKHLFHDKVCIRLGNQRWNGIIPIFINILIINIVLELRGDSIVELINIDINMIDEDDLWIIKYFIVWSLIFFLFLIIGINEIKFNSNLIHENKILFDDNTIVVLNRVILINIIFEILILIKKRIFFFINEVWTH